MKPPLRFLRWRDLLLWPYRRLTMKRRIEEAERRGRAYADEMGWP